jgi:hypothetical protein
VVATTEKCERTRHRSSTSATDVKVEHTRERPVTPPAETHVAPAVTIEGAGGRAPVTRLEVVLPLCRSPRLDQASARGSRGLLESKADTLVGQRCGRETRSGSRSRRAPRPVFDLPRERRCRRTNPGTFTPHGTAILHRGPFEAPAEPTKGVHFSRTKRLALDGAHRHARGREADSVAQHATETTCLRRPSDVLRNVSPASR